MEMALAREDHFVDAHRADLIERVVNVKRMADILLQQKMLHKEVYEEIMAGQTPQEKMRRLLRPVCAVDEKKYFFYTLLQEYESSLLEELAQGNRERLNTDQTIIQYKEKLCTEYGIFQEYNPLPGEDLLLTGRYTKPLIIQQHRSEEEKKKELRARGQEHRDVLNRSSKDGSSTSVEQLFSPDRDIPIPKGAILQGDSGYGKSFTVQKIVYDWALGDLYNDQFSLVLHLSCKELNLLSGEKNVLELLNCSSRFIPMIREILTNTPEKVLFIIDGFDELTFQLNKATKSPSDAFTKAPIEDTLSVLLNGHILDKSFLLVTTRSTASDKLGKLLRHPQRFTEILGFSEKAVKEYFNNFFKDTQKSEEVYKVVEADKMLSTACSIPVICWIVCSAFRDNDVNLQGLETTTSIFLHFVSLLLEHHCQGLNQTGLALLRSLAELAERGLLTKQSQVLLEEKWVLEATPDPTKVPFLCKFLKKERTRVKTWYSFMHLSFQEFFAALHCLMTDDDEAQGKLEKRLTDIFSNVMEQNVIRFLFGLSSEEGRKFLNENYNISISPAVCACLKQWILESSSNAKFEFVLSCLYERHEETLVREAMKSWGKINFFQFISDMSCWMLSYCILCCSSVEGLEIKLKTAEQLKILQPALPRCEILRLNLHNLEDAVAADDFFTALEDTTVADQPKLSNLQKVETTVSYLTKEWAQRILSHIQTRANLKYLEVVEVVDECTREDRSVCTCIAVRKYMRDSCCLYDFIFENFSSSASGIMPAIRYIALTLPESTAMFSFDWKDILQELYLMNNTKGFRYVFKPREAFFMSLHSLPGLQRVHLEVPCFTKSWAQGILSLVRTCTSIKHMTLWVKRSPFEWGDLNETEVQELKKSGVRSDITLILKGYRRNFPQELVVIKFEGNDVREEKA